MIGDDPDKVPYFFRRLMAGLQGLGAQTEVCPRNYDALDLPAPEGHFDFVHMGRTARPMALNLGIAYLGGYFTLGL